MDLSSSRSQNEDRIAQRQLYRAGQNQPAQASASTASRPSSPAAAKPKRASASSGDNKGQRILLMILLLGVGYYLLNGTPSQRRKAFIGLGVVGWLLLLGSISYCLSLPDLEALNRELNRERMAIFQDQSLSPEQMREKFAALREKEKNLTPDQRKQMREIDRKERTRKMNSNTFNFLQMSEEEQVAQLKKEAEEWEKRRKEWEKRRQQFRKAGGNRNGQNGGKGGGQNGGRGVGPGGWGGGGGGGNEAAAFEGRQGAMSPEARAGGLHKAMMREQMGLGGGGPGGGRGGRGGPPGGG